MGVLIKNFNSHDLIISNKFSLKTPRGCLVHDRNRNWNRLALESIAMGIEMAMSPKAFGSWPE